MNPEMNERERVKVSIRETGREREKERETDRQTETERSTGFHLVSSPGPRASPG